MKKFVLAWMAVSALIFSGVSAWADSSAADAILGIWHTTDDKSQVLIFKSNGQYFGRVAGLKEPNWPATAKPELAGKPKRDGKNPKPELRQRPIMGLEFMSNFVYAGKDRWDDGKIYDPESGKTYKCKLTLQANGRLEVRGYIGFSLLGRTVTWTR